MLIQEWRCRWSSADRQCSNYIWVINNFIMPPPSGAGGIMFLGCPSIHLSVHPLEAWNTLFSHEHGSVGPSDQPWPFCGMSFQPSVPQSWVVSRHFLENTWREWLEILHADASWPPSELIRLWSWSVDFPLLVPLSFTEMGRIWIPVECIKGIAKTFACWCILTISRTD